MILYEEGDNSAQQDEAHRLVGLLTYAYPDHPWAVRVTENMAFVRYLDPLWEEMFRGPVGFVVKLKGAYSASQMKRDVLNAGGQLLEMMNLRRGYANGDQPTKIEGVPKQFEKREADITTLVSPDGMPLRTEPRPQVLNGLS